MLKAAEQRDDQAADMDTGPSPELERLVALYGSRLDAAHALKERFASIDALINGYLAWVEAKPGDAGVPLVEAVMEQAVRQQSLVAEAQGPALMAVGGVLCELANREDFRRLFVGGVYRHGVKLIPDGLIVDGAGMDLWTFERQDPATAEP